jgi:hypothetical protein
VVTNDLTFIALPLPNVFGAWQKALGLVNVGEPTSKNDTVGERFGATIISILGKVDP